MLTHEREVNLDNLETQLIWPERISSKALRYILGEVAVIASMGENEQAEAIKSRAEYWLKIREGQGEQQL